MKVVISPQSFKGTLTADEAAQAIEEGIHSVDSTIETVLAPIADGGDDTVAVLTQALGGEIRQCEVQGPLGDPVEAVWGWIPSQHLAIIESAKAIGITLIAPEEKNPLLASSYGLGQVIKAALDCGAKKCIVGIGGTVTNDGGAGMAQALGAKFLDPQGVELPRGGGALHNLVTIDTDHLDPRLSKTEFNIATDVTNPVLGSEGATAIYGPQKGATPEMLEQLEKSLAKLCDVVKEKYHIQLHAMPRAGAGGGLGGGCHTFLNGTLGSGIDFILNAMDYDTVISGADLVITGEGCLDGQTIYDKGPIGVARRAQKQNIPVVAIGGCLGQGHDKVLRHGIQKFFATTDYDIENPKARLVATVQGSGLFGIRKEK